MELYDFFGNLIEPGDIIVRSRLSMLEERKVVNITKSGYIYVERYDHELKWLSFEQRKKPLCLHYCRSSRTSIINLTKLKLR